MGDWSDFQISWEMGSTTHSYVYIYFSNELFLMSPFPKCFMKYVNSDVS